MKQAQRFVAFILLMVMVMTSQAFAQDYGIDLTTLTLEELTALQDAVQYEIYNRSSGSSDEIVTGKLGKFTVSIMDAYVTKDQDGDDCIVVTFEWSHAEEEPQSFMWAFIYTAYQDGIETDLSYSVHDMQYDNDIKSIKAGATLKTQIAFKLDNLESPVDIEISELMSWSNAKLEKTFRLK